MATQDCADARGVIAELPVRPEPRRSLAALGLAAAMTSGCTGTTGHLALASTRDVDLATIERPSGRHVKGRSCIHVVTVVPIGLPKIGAAIEDALRQTGGTALVDVVVGYEVYDIPLVYGLACYVVEGEAR